MGQNNSHPNEAPEAKAEIKVTNVGVASAPEVKVEKIIDRSGARVTLLRTHFPLPLARLIDTLAGEDCLERLDRLKSLILSKNDWDDTLVRELGKQLMSIPHITRCLSDLYCMVFRKQAPTRQVKSRKDKKQYPCVGCGTLLYPDEPIIYRCHCGGPAQRWRNRTQSDWDHARYCYHGAEREVYCSDCGRREYDPRPHRSGGVRFHKHPDWYVHGSKTPRTFTVVIPTRAFQELRKYQPNLLLLDARDIFDHVKKCGEEKKKR